MTSLGDVAQVASIAVAIVTVVATIMTMVATIVTVVGTIVKIHLQCLNMEREKLEIKKLEQQTQPPSFAEE